MADQCDLNNVFPYEEGKFVENLFSRIGNWWKE